MALRWRRGTFRLWAVFSAIWLVALAPHLLNALGEARDATPIFELGAVSAVVDQDIESLRAEGEGTGFDIDSALKLARIGHGTRVPLNDLPDSLRPNSASDLEPSAMFAVMRAGHEQYWVWYADGTKVEVPASTTSRLIAEQIAQYFFGARRIAEATVLREQIPALLGVPLAVLLVGALSLWLGGWVIAGFRQQPHK